MATTSTKKSTSSSSMGPGLWGLSLCGYEDMFEGQAFSALNKMQTLGLNTTKACMERQADFAYSRWQEDLDLLSKLSECREPQDAAETVRDFYSRMMDAYTKHFSAQTELFQSGLSESLTTAEELRETATEISKAATETVTKAANDTIKPKAA